MCINIDAKTSTAELRLSKEFYSEKAVEEAIKLFNEVEFTKKDREGYFYISMKCAGSTDLRENALEFCNLVLAIVKGTGL